MIFRSDARSSRPRLSARLPDQYADNCKPDKGESHARWLEKRKTGQIEATQVKFILFYGSREQFSRQRVREQRHSTTIEILPEEDVPQQIRTLTPPRSDRGCALRVISCSRLWLACPGLCRPRAPRTWSALHRLSERHSGCSNMGVCSAPRTAMESRERPCRRAASAHLSQVPRDWGSAQRTEG
jgi:hypothetical protein